MASLSYIYVYPISLYINVYHIKEWPFLYIKFRKSLINIDHGQYSWWSIYRDSTVTVFHSEFLYLGISFHKSKNKKLNIKKNRVWQGSNLQSPDS